MHIRTTLLPSLLLGSLLLAGCVKTGSVTVTQPPGAELASYDAIVVSAATDVPELQKYLPKLQQSIAGDLKKDGVFSSASAGATAPAGAVTLHMSVAKTGSGNRMARMMNVGGEVEVEVTCELVDDSKKATLARFVAKGNSARKSKASVNGFDTTVADDLDGRAMRAAGAEIVAYLENNSPKK